MPTYEYACRDCGHQLEIVQAFTEDPLTVCPECGGDLRKLFSAVGISFKGSGFYKTDSRLPHRDGGSSASTSSGGSSDSGSSSTSSSSSSSSTGSSTGGSSSSSSSSSGTSAA